MRKADINTVAEACAVSKTTVSKVFTQKYGVSDAMRNRIIRTARRLNYTPRQMMAQETIAMVVDSNAFAEGSSFQSMIMASVMNKLTDSGYLLKIVTTDEMKYLLQSYAKLAILTTGADSAPNIAGSLMDMNIPVLAVNKIIDDCYCVCSDHAQSIELAVEHLVARGHSRISLMLDKSDNWGGRQRLQGYETAMEKNGLSMLPSYICSETNSIVECLSSIRSDGATALIVEGEGIIHETVYMMGILQINIPGDMSVISSEILSHSRWFMPPHTTTCQHLDSLAEKIKDVAVRIVEGELDSPSVAMLKSSLIERNSVKNIS